MQQQKLKEETLYTKKKHISFDCFSETDTNSAVFQIDFFFFMNGKLAYLKYFF